MMESDFLRQLDILNPELLEGLEIVLIGAGGIGSPTALVLAKMGCRQLHIIDPDLVENHNLPNQLFYTTDKGRVKVEALKNVVGAFTDYEPIVYQERFKGQCRSAQIVISGVDSMAARKEIWQIVSQSPHALYIDARMGAEAAKILAGDPLDGQFVAYYEASLCNDDEVEPLPCTAQTIIYTPWITAGFIAHLVARWVKIHNGNEAGDSIPFCTRIMLWPPLTSIVIEESL